MRIKRRKGLPEAKGQAMVEFLLTILFVTLTIFATLEVIMMVYTYSVMADAAKEGVRYAIVHGCSLGTSYCSGTCSPACTDASAANVTSQVTGYAKLSFHDVSGIKVSVTYPDGGALAPNRVRVVVNYPYVPYIPALGLGTPTINAAAEGRIAF